MSNHEVIRVPLTYTGRALSQHEKKVRESNFIWMHKEAVRRARELGGWKAWLCEEKENEVVLRRVGCLPTDPIVNG